MHRFLIDMKKVSKLISQTIVEVDSGFDEGPTEENNGLTSFCPETYSSILDKLNEALEIMLLNDLDGALLKGSTRIDINKEIQSQD